MRWKEVVGCSRRVEKKGEEIGSQRLCKSTPPNPEDHENALHFN